MRINDIPSLNNILSEEKARISLSQLRKTQSVLIEDYNNKLVFKKIVLPGETLNIQLKIYEWRNSIQKGVLRCPWTCILPVDQKSVLIQTKRKYYPYTLKNITKISLTQLLHILRQILYGFELLYKKFGGFQVQDDLIYFDQNFEIEVWGSNEPSSNLFKLKEQSQHEFLCSIFQLLERHQIKSNIGIEFNQGLLRYQNLTFDIVNSYVDHFITRKQLIIGSHKSIKEIFMYPKSLKQIKENNEKNVQKFTSLNFIQFTQTQKNAQKDKNLMFSPSKKMQRKRTNLTSPYSAKVLKDSDLTTEETQNLSCSRDNSISKLDRLREDKGYFHSQFGSPKCQSKTSKSHLHQVCQAKKKEKLSDKKLGEKQSKQIGSFSGFQRYMRSNSNLKVSICQQIEQEFNQRTQPPIKQMETLSINMPSHHQNSLLDYSREALTESDDEDPSETSSNTNILKNLQTSNTHQRQSDQQPESRPQIDLMIFQQKLQNNYKIFNDIDSLAQSKQMTNSIQIGVEKRRISPVKLQKLAKIQTKLYESIIQDEYFGRGIFQTTQIQKQ